MGLFGGGDKAAENEAIRAERDRLASLPLVDLAEEVVRRLFTGDGPGTGPGWVPSFEVWSFFDPGSSLFGVDDAAKAQIRDIVLEGVQVAEHACLVRWQFEGGDTSSMSLVVTRLGRQALADGAVRRLLGA